jgi:hypothetical protein
MSIFDTVGGGGLLGRQVGVDLRVRHLDLGVDLVVDQALHDDLVADLLAEMGEGHAFLFHLVAHLLHAHLLRFGDAADGAVQFDIRDADAVFLAQLELGALGNHGLDDLAAQVFRIRQLGVLGTQARGDLAHAVVDFTPGDDLVVDDDVHGIDDLGGARRRRQESRWTARATASLPARPRQEQRQEPRPDRRTAGPGRRRLRWRTGALRQA